MNCYIVASRQKGGLPPAEEKTRSGIVIDPGDEVERILLTAQKEAITIEKIVNTHGHIDHTAGVKELQDRLNIPFYIHKSDEMYLDTIPQQAQLFGLRTVGTPNVDGFLQEGDTVTFDDVSLRIIHTPGHTPGGVCLLGEKDIIVGDTLFCGSIGRTDLPGGDYEELIRSIETKLLPLDDNITVYSGHGPVTTIGVEKKTNPFLIST